jgi:fatty acid desaturase
VKVVVAGMPEAVQTQSHRQDLRLTLNSDGQSHPVLNILAVFTLLAGVAAFVCGVIVRAHFPATIIGIVGFAVGLATQLNSATREERVLIVTGIIAAFVGMALGIGHGGFG